MEEQIAVVLDNARGFALDLEEIEEMFAGLAATAASLVETIEELAKLAGVKDD